MELTEAALIVYYGNFFKKTVFVLRKILENMSLYGSDGECRHLLILLKKVLKFCLTD